MGLSFDEMRRIDEEERIRAIARARHAATQERYEESARQREERAGQRRVATLEHRQRYVQFHGRDRAFRTTLMKWVLGALIFSVIGFFSSLEEEGFLSALGDAVLFLAVISGVGVIRAYHVVNSVR